jgi:hypothetical protein
VDKDKIPDAHSGLPKPIERRLVSPYSGTFLGRIGAAAVVRALGVLLRKHPRAALHIVGAGALQAAKATYTETKKTLLSRSQPSAAHQPRPITKIDKQKLKALRKALEDNATVERGEPAPRKEARAAERPSWEDENKVS